MAGRDYGGSGDAKRDGYTCLSERRRGASPDEPFQPKGKDDDSYGYGYGGRRRQRDDVNTRYSPRRDRNEADGY